MYVHQLYKMNNMIEFLSQPWPWYVSGPLISLVMFLLLRFGGNFGVSSTLRSMCSMVGAGKHCEFFDFNWKEQRWNLLVVLGAMLGGFVAVHFMSDATNVALNPKTIEQLSQMGIDAPNGKLLPDALFSSSVFQSPKSIIILLVGGILIGFGTRYAGGCTSGHAIMGLSNLQLPSLIATISYMAGGFIMANLILPFILSL